MNSCTRKTVSHATERTHTGRLPVERCNIVSSVRILIRHFRNERETVLGLLLRNWPIADRGVFSEDPETLAGRISAPGARFSKAPVRFRARNQIFKSKYKE